MTKQILVIHGGEAFDTHEEYISYLEKATVSLENLSYRDWKAHLADALGREYQVLAPQMPCKHNAKYAEWKVWFEKFIPLLDDHLVLIGHSLGGIFIAKYLSENIISKKLRAVFLVAAPYNTGDVHPVADFVLREDLSGLAHQSGDLFFYHSEDDQVVPFDNLEQYRKELSSAHFKILKGRGHINQVEFPELVADIRSLAKS